MASIVLLLSELLGGESTSVMAADWYMSGHSLREFRPVAAAPAAAAAVAKCERPAAEAAGEKKKEESFEDLAAVSRIAVDVMWP
ncbi:unknown protein [Oryza sativa Japonica Group]|jgi:hypothetical protein|uniref:Os01g0266400 protein n=3 Tax=Oryza sativa TaxID=4530 RepID=A0A0P0V1B6_ORYSJ|nr:uncharacterized protein LOC4324374 [Oryza sativa Japonica Group]EAY73428.1 hypothetical protein OsI_01308 [Oryza sativa Indica Group]KAB8080897.1 hypothetical protein EE612_001645 [Oryza sativa]EAZ11352.1 hypothetical protein OsJ_01219 [Oryza sativa Japonica Group]KAF2949548.1 hypothetical protein DAI22_01g119000 [Oryza sativa Japonica Group]BAD81133.1 unknown protein [Oryza sativa Japonica Group]|eukprot:NP_001042678.2 Os01g0266400 [Oryza sativa Japonica Group]